MVTPGLVEGILPDDWTFAQALYLARWARSES